MSKGFLHKLRKLKGRSATELRVRGAQMLHAQAERAGLSTRTRVLSDQEFFGLFDVSSLHSADLSASGLLEYFRSRNRPNFLPAFVQPEATRAELSNRFAASDSALLARAHAINLGTFDLLSHRGLDFGIPVDWHLEPVSSRRAPLVHWSRIDFLDSRVAGDKKITWELNRCQHFMTLGRAYWRTKDKVFADSFAAHAASWMDANPPTIGVNWASSLEVSLRSIAWLWGIYFFKDADALTPQLFLRLLKFLYAHARHIETYLSTYFAPNTHLTGEALGLYYLGTLLPEFKRAGHWRALGARILLAQLPRHVLSDGSYFEHSTYYERYTADFYTHFLLLARANDIAAQDGKGGKLEEKLTTALDHLMYITRPDGTSPYVGDDDGGRLAALDDRAPDDFRATLAVGGGVYSRGDYKFVAGEAPESLLWLLGPQGLQDYDLLRAHPPSTGSRGFPDGGYYVMRDGWKRDDNYMLFLAGSHGARALNFGHAHADALSFELAPGGRTLLVDPGTYTYTGSKEMRDWFRSSLAHNTLTIDGESSSLPDGPFSWRQIARSSAANWTSCERFDYVKGRHDGYSRLPAPATHSRSILFLKKNYWIIRDQVTSAAEHRADLQFHFNAEAAPLIEVLDDELPYLTERGAHVGLDIAVAGRGQWRREDGWVSHCYGEKSPARFYSYSALVNGDDEMLTFMLPRASVSEIQPRVREVEAIGGKAFEVTHEKGVDIVMIRKLGTGQPVEMERLTSNFEWTWARFAGHGEPIPEELILIGGQSLRLDGREIVKLERRLEYMVASRRENQFQIVTDAGTVNLGLPVNDLDSLYADSKRPTTR
jgi:hypothetical protein